MVRPPFFENQNVKRGIWSAEEDAKMLQYVSKHGARAGLRRFGKSCRLRWTNHLRSDIKHESFTLKEEELIVKLHAAIGSRWAIISQQLPGRTDNDVKNYWNTKLRKKLVGMGIDPVTHKPFSQILADYGNVGGLPKAVGMRIGSLNKDLKNAAILMKAETHSSSFPPFKVLSNLTVSPKTEPTQDSSLRNNLSGNHSLDLLAQLQAIKLVTESSNYPNFFSDQGMFSSSSSSSSCCSYAAQEISPLAFNWNDFLLEDAFLQSDKQEKENPVEISSQNLLPQDQNQSERMDYTISNNDGNETSDCESSFVEALLARDNEMLLEFPDLLGEPFY
ncbi:hypothetical protein UlMin_008075 [Ulmus minor]